MTKDTASAFQNYEIMVLPHKGMVLPLVDEYKPKCYLCNNAFDTIEKLREHQEKDHGDFVSYHKNQKREPAPGDVSVF
ncbi:MAG: hypothetical protein WAO91_06740 [Candidatus Nitrosotenuis sp.]